MKKIFLILIAFLCVLLTACSNDITLDNVDTLDNTFQYSKVSMGKLRECKDEGIISEAKDFTNKFFSISLNRSYEDNTTLGHETIMFSNEFLDANKEKLEKDITEVKEFYKEYELTTELVNIDYEKVVNCKGDAYVVCVARLRLQSCNDDKVSKIIGFEDGIGSDVLCKYSLKLKYVNRGYMVYDCKVIEEAGYMLHIKEYNKVIADTLTKKEKLERFAFVVSKAQNDRDYRTFEGDEDYKYLSKAYKNELNKDRDDAKYTRDLYIKNKMVTKLEDCEIVGIGNTDNGYVIRVVLKIKMQECISPKVAQSVGFSDGVGSVGEKMYDYYIIEEDGAFKLNGLQYLS